MSLPSAKPAPPRLTPARARRESARRKRQRTEQILERLGDEYPGARCALDHYERYAQAVPKDEAAAMWIADLRNQVER